MPRSFVVVKLLMLRWLLACISCVDGYEFGYHPSAEEFDNFLRDHRRTWTSGLLAERRRDSWYSPVTGKMNGAGAGSTVAQAAAAAMASLPGEYVPKYNYENARRRYELYHSHLWPPGEGVVDQAQPTHLEPIKPTVMSFDQATSDSVLSSNIVGGEEEVLGNVFSSAMPAAAQQQPHKRNGTLPGTIIQIDTIEEELPFSTGNKAEVTRLPLPQQGGPNTASPSFNIQQVKPLQRPIIAPSGTVIEIDHDLPRPLALPTKKRIKKKKRYPPAQSSAANDDEQLPIFFTNPSTGIVYAITEVGKVPDNANALGYNGSIPIYITKEQYDRDLRLVRQHYESACRRPSAPTAVSSVKPAKADEFSSFSKPAKASNTTMRPQIIRLQQKPPFVTRRPSSVSKLPTIDMPIGLYKPATFTGVSGQIGVISTTTQAPIRTTARPTKNTNKKRPKKKRTKKRRTRKGPGRRLTVAPATTTPTPKATFAPVPNIVKGVRAQEPREIPPTNSDRYATQLEKPNAPTTTIFNDLPIVSKRGYMSNGIAEEIRPPALPLYPNHRMRRSTDLQQAPVKASHQQKDANAWRNTGSKYKVRRRTTKTGTGSKPKTTGKDAPMQRFAHAIFLAKHGQGGNHTHLGNDTHSVLPNEAAFKDLPLNAGTSQQHELAKGGRRASSKRSRKRKPDDNDSDEEFDIFDFLEDVAEGGKDNEEKGGDDDYYDDDDDSLYADESDTKKKAGLFTSALSTAVEKLKHTLTTTMTTQEQITEETVDDLREDIAQGNSSSAEEGADVGALEEEPTEFIASTTPPTQTQEVIDAPATATKVSAMSVKKRIRRRPPSTESYASQEDYYDDDDGGDGESGIGSFFRMIFYPVQMAMTRIMDGFVGEKDDTSAENVQAVTPSKYPTYTLYHNGLSGITAAADQEDEAASEQGSFFGDWFGSWFGFNRRTKNIGSTTKAPSITLVPQVAPPTESTAAATTAASSWWDWFGWGGGGTATPAAVDNDSEEDDKWFFGWFDTKPKVRRRASTTTTTSTTTPLGSLPQMPILTIVDPMRNPQNWIGILAHHIANATATQGGGATTHNPLMEAFTRATSTTTTTADPDVPRHISYEKYQIWRLRPLDDGQVKVLEQYKRSEEGMQLQWLKGPSLRGLTDVLVPPRKLVDFRGTLNFETIAHEILIFDVGKAIAYERAKEAVHLSQAAVVSSINNNNNGSSQQQTPSVGPNKLPMSWHKYHNYDDIVQYLEMIRVRHPQIVELIHIGRSYEGRPLIVVKLEMQRNVGVAGAAGGVGGGAQWAGHKKLKYKRKSGHANAIFLESGAHGLEWIGPATTTWMINEVLRIMKNNKTGEEYDFIRKTTWYIMPVLNPDGYVYTHEYDRFWRKTRSRHISRANGLIDSAMNWLQQKAKEKVCYGVDLDRNWHYQWGKRGSSKAPCNEFFAGPQPFSEPETKALSEFLMDQRKRIKLYASLQAYGQVIAFPVRANTSFNAERMEDFLDVAMVGVDGLRKKGSKARYKVDATSDMNDQRSGSGDAFATYEVGVPFSYTIQLADNGVHGYLLPGSSIEPTARDAFEVITAMLDYI